MTSSITHPRQFTESGAEVLQPEGWPIPRGYANGLMAEGKTDRYRWGSRLG